ncbi:sucrase/ferredoxin-like domain-containing protein [Aspergillus novofumigatus IBT 16806]|uniref:Sucrase/ferredoxin domain protein n=1 Tax=Aspergillus novofumigatus (strain IBT 16806) TaxID=1392255 RepID=A0A2I1C4S7_ASPN1|nr:uncharacterized protein P174DRAFT_504753 [Aspergillus novofumigatus IBT 16806]PKX92632.1 hypothetical protein P174DRAFT_504753 [Aspergillus novofumigatus IBT 16806]
MQALLRRGASLFGSTPSGSPKESGDFGEFRKAPSHDVLFPKVDPAVDGEECLHDCASCSVKYPARFDVDYEDELYGHVNGWATHLLVATGKTDWVRDVADEKGSLMEAIEKGDLCRAMGYATAAFSLSRTDENLKLSASNMPVPDEYHHHEPGEQPTNVLILPAFTVVEQVTPALAPELIKYFVSRAPTTTTPLGSIPEPLAETEGDGEEQPASVDISSLTSLRSRPCGHAAVILLCSQRTRDARCGQSAPLLRREFERHLRALELYRDLNDERPGGVGIYFISHVGGHKYAANVIVYRRRDFEWYRKEKRGQDAQGKTTGEADEGAAQGIWLARVRPEDCENIVKYTVLQGKVVKPGLQLREYGTLDKSHPLSRERLCRKWVHDAVNDATPMNHHRRVPDYGCGTPTPQYPTTPEYAVFHSLDSSRSVAGPKVQVQQPDYPQHPTQAPSRGSFVKFYWKEVSPASSQSVAPFRSARLLSAQW